MNKKTVVEWVDKQVHDAAKQLIKKGGVMPEVLSRLEGKVLKKYPFIQRELLVQGLRRHWIDQLQAVI